MQLLAYKLKFPQLIRHMEMVQSWREIYENYKFIKNNGGIGKNVKKCSG